MPSQLDFTAAAPDARGVGTSSVAVSRPVGASSFVVAGDSGTAVDSALGPTFQQTVLVTSGPGRKCLRLQDLTGEHRLSLLSSHKDFFYFPLNEAFTCMLVGLSVGTILWLWRRGFPAVHCLFSCILKLNDGTFILNTDQETRTAGNSRIPR